MKYLILALALFTTTASATELLLGGWSKHYIDTDEEFNEEHNMIGLRENGWSIGTFTNSYYNRSVFVSKTFELYKYKDVSFNLVAGIVTGYEEYQTKKAYIGKGKSLYLTPVISYKYKIVTFDSGLLMMEDGFALMTSIAVKF